MKLRNSYQDWNKKEKIKNYPEEKYKKKNIITDNTDIKRMVREFFEQQYVKFKNFNEMGSFQGKQIIETDRRRKNIWIVSYVLKN